MEDSSTNQDAQESTRRRSGRVVRKPEQFVDGMVPSSKRKRPQNDDLNAQEEEDTSSNEEDVDESDAASEELRETKRKTKRTNSSKSATKRTKVNGFTAALPSRPASQKARRPKKGARDASAEEVGGLYAAVFGSGNDLDDVATQWLERFEQDESNAITEIVNFVLKCTGCSIEVTIHDIEDPDNCASKLADIQKEYQAQSIVEYPIISKGQKGQVFKRTLSEFFNSLIKAIAGAELLYDRPILLENIQVWVSAMTSAQIRPFRHTATIISLSIISALSETGRSIIDSRAKSLRQEDGESKKKKPNKGILKDLRATATKLGEQGTVVDNTIKDWFDTVFVHRYRDRDPKVRVDCVTYLSHWIMTYPEQFFDGSHLRYLGWVLSDENAPTRVEVVKQLQKIYKDDTKIAGLRQFTDRFRSRMVEMAAMDGDPNVRVLAIELTNTLRESGMLEPDDIDTVGKLIFDSDARVRRAVVPFFVASVEETVASKVEDLGGEEALDDALPTIEDDDFDQPRATWLNLKSLAELLSSFEPDDEEFNSIEPGPGSQSSTLIAAGVDSRISLAAQSFADKLPEMENWEVLAGLLLFDKSETAVNGQNREMRTELIKACALEEREEAILLDILFVAVKNSLAEKMENAKKPNKTKAERQLLKEERDSAAHRLALLIPKLLSKYGASPSAVSAVLRLVHVLNFEDFEELRQGSTTFATLLNDINRQFLAHENQNVLGKARDALLQAKSAEELREITDGKVQELWDDTLHTLLVSSRGDAMTARGSINLTSLSRIGRSILRMSNLAAISDCTEILETPKQVSTSEARRKQKQRNESSVVPVALLIDAIRRGIPSGDLEQEVDEQEDFIVATSAQCLLYYFMWHYGAMKTAVEAGKSVDASKFSTLVDRGNVFSMNLARVMAKRHGAEDLRVTVAGTLLDVHTIFHMMRQTLKAAPNAGQLPINELSVEIEQDDQAQLIKVFVAAEKNYAKKSGKGVAEPAEDDEPEDLSDGESSSASGDDDAEEDGDDEEAGRRKRKRRERKLAESMMAEQTLCTFGAKIVLAIIAGVVDSSEGHEGQIRKRLCRNKTKFGQNFREVCAGLDPKVQGASKDAKGKATAQKGSAAVRGAVAKSNERVQVEDEESDEDVQMQQEEDEEDRQDQVASGDDDLVDATGVVVEADAASEDDESVMGD